MHAIHFFAHHLHTIIEVWCSKVWNRKSYICPVRLVFKYLDDDGESLAIRLIVFREAVLLAYKQRVRYLDLMIFTKEVGLVFGKKSD